MSLFRKNKDQVLAVISNGNKLIVILADCRSELPETQLCDTVDDDGSKASYKKNYSWTYKLL